MAVVVVVLVRRFKKENTKHSAVEDVNLFFCQITYVTKLKLGKTRYKPDPLQRNPEKKQSEPKLGNKSRKLGKTR